MPCIIPHQAFCILSAAQASETKLTELKRPEKRHLGPAYPPISFEHSQTVKAIKGQSYWRARQLPWACSILYACSWPPQLNLLIWICIPLLKKKNPCNIYPKRSMPLGPRRKELKINTVSETGKVTDDISQREGRRGQSWDYQSGWLVISLRVFILKITQQSVLYGSC